MISLANQIEGFRKKNFIAYFIVGIVLFSLSSCVGMQNSALEEVISEDKIKNKQTALAMGQRTFDASKKQLMKAVITAFSNKNIAIMNLDKEIGFMIGEGGEFLDPVKARELGERRIERINRKAGFQAYHYVAGNYTLRVTVNLYEKGAKRTLAKMGFTTLVVSGSNQPKHDETISELLPAYYEEMWDAIRNALFIQREAIE